MPLAQTGLSVGSVSRCLTGILTTALWSTAPGSPKVTVQRPQADPATGTATSSRINLFLYEVEIDGAMRNIALTPGTQPPLWVVLKYLLTTFDEAGDSDTTESHDLLGLSMQVLMSIRNDMPGVSAYPALTDNPEPLKLTFDQATPELLSRLMQGPDDKFRCSAAFQVRPVMIAQPLPPTGLQLIGINYRLGTIIGAAGIQNYVLPGLGPVLNGSQPAAVELGDTLTLLGNGLAAPGLSVNFGNASLVPNQQHPQALSVRIQGLDPGATSAGNIPVTITQTLSATASISSGVITVALLPTVMAVTLVSIAAVGGPGSKVYATVLLAGTLLGGPSDYVEFALVSNAQVAVLLDTTDPSFTPPAGQTAQQFAMSAANAIAPGLYYVIVRVNGAQNKNAFTLNMVAP